MRPSWYIYKLMAASAISFLHRPHVCIPVLASVSRRIRVIDSTHDIGLLWKNSLRDLVSLGWPSSPAFGNMVGGERLSPSASPSVVHMDGSGRKRKQKVEKERKRRSSFLKGNSSSVYGKSQEKEGSGNGAANILVDEDDDGEFHWQYHIEEGDDADENEPAVAFMDAVVKVYCTHTEPNFSLPWQKRRQFSSTGSGFIISGKRLLTNAHCVVHHTQVKVKRRGDDRKFVATVLAIGTECDIALLAVEDDEFWEGPNHVKFGTLPRLQDAVTVVGYPIGGDSISVTSGVVSRIEVTSYAHGSYELLGLQIDAAINAGNSGGPAFNDDGECVGIAFQSLKGEDAENIGYVIPTPVIFHFLGDYKRNNKYTGFPAIGISWQKMENPAMRASLGMEPNQKGVLVRKVQPTSPSYNIMNSGDIIVSFDGVPVASDGTVPFRTGERISFGFLVSQKFSGETAKIEVLRGGKLTALDVTLAPPKKLIPVHIDGQPPSYYIIGGLVFTPVVQPFLESEYGHDYEYETPVTILNKLLNGSAEHSDEEVVVLSQVLANDVNIGYEDIRNSHVLNVNDTKIRNLEHLTKIVDQCNEKYLRFELERAQLVVLETKSAKLATREVLLDHSIPHDRSIRMQKTKGDLLELAS